MPFLGRVYASPASAISTGTAAQDLYSALAATQVPFMMHEVVINFESVTTAAEVRIRHKREASTVTQGSGGTAVTPTILEPRNLSTATAAQTVVHAGDTTVATTTGATANYRYETVQVLNGYQYLPPPEDRPVLAGLEAYVVDLGGTSLGSALTYDITGVHEELL